MKNLKYLLPIISLFFLGCGKKNGYQKKWGKWQYNSFNWMNGSHITEMDGVHNWSFEILGESKYARDKNRVYFRGRVVEGADTPSFEAMGNEMDFGKDKDYVFFGTERIENSHPQTFQKIENTKYLKDKNLVYMGGNILEGADPISFEIIDDEEGYAKDKKHVFLNNFWLSELDASTFQKLGSPYCRDAKTVYCGTIPLRVNYPETFKVLKTADRINPYKKENIIESNPTMSYLNDIAIKGGWLWLPTGAYAEAKGQFFDDFLEVEKPDSLNLQ